MMKACRAKNVVGRFAAHFALCARVGALVFVVAGPGCGSTDSGGSGGSSGGGSSNTGGSTSDVGGGSSTGGSNTGGSDVGGGSSTGGSNTGGSDTSGSGMGGASSGGSNATGGNSAPLSGECGTMPAGALLPLAAQYTWTYKVTDVDGTSSTKVNTVYAEEAVGQGPNKDVKAFKVVTTKKDGTDKSESWQATVGDKVVRYREDAFRASDGTLSEIDYWEPYRLRVDGSAEHTVAGATWKDSYKETKLPQGAGATATQGVQTEDQWSIVSAYECVDVPAGTGINGAVAAGKLPAVRFKKGTTNNSKQYLYVRGIGKVREEGTGQTEQLISFDLSP